jgi:hypothetical protein
MEENPLLKLHRILSTRFNDEEFRTLCDLHIKEIKYDDLGGAGLADKARELITYFDRRSRFHELIEIIRSGRPDISLEGLPNAIQTDAHPATTENDALSNSLTTKDGASRRVRYVAIGAGVVIALMIPVLLFLVSRPSSSNDIPPVSLVGLNYTVDGWNTYSLDLRTASDSGIWVDSQGKLQFSDLWISIPANAPEYQVHAEFYGSDDNTTPIGASKAIPLIFGVTQLGDVLVNKGLQYEDQSDTWRVQKNWESITITLVTQYGNDVVARTPYSVKFGPPSHAWFHTPPNVTFASIVYAINDGPDQILDFRGESKNGTDYTGGIVAAHPFTLTLREVWYESNDQREGSDMTLHADLKVDDMSIETAKRQTNPLPIQAGIQKAPPFESASWAIPANFTSKKYTLVVYWIRNDGAAMNTINVPIRFSATAGATPVVGDKVLPVEAIPSGMNAYLTDDADPASSSRLVIIYGSNPDITYKHKYSFPDNAKGSAGLVFEFAQPEDLSTYHSIEFTIAINGSPKSCSIGLRDRFGRHDQVLCQGPFASSSGITAKIDSDKQTITIPLRKNYTNVAMEAIDQVYTEMMPGTSEGNSDVKISDIKFIKQ